MRAPSVFLAPQSITLMDPTSSSLASSAAGSLSQSSLSSSFDASGLDVDAPDMDYMVIQDVQNLSDALKKLINTLDPPPQWPAKESDQSDDANSVAAATEQKCIEIHKSFSEVRKIILDLTNRYSFLQCSEMYGPTTALAQLIKGINSASLNFVNVKENFAKIRTSVEKLQFAVAECVGDFLTWEMAQYEINKLSQSSEELSGSVPSPVHQSSSSGGRIPREKRYGGLQRRHSTFQTKSGQECASSEEIDKVLQKMESGVELAFSRAKAWSKYCKEILNFVHRRINLESEHAKNVQKLSETTRLAIQDDNFLPLKNIYLSSFKIEHEFFDNCMDTMKRLYEYKYIKPLEARKTEHDTKRKELRMLWDRQVRQANDIKTELKKAKQNHSTKEMGYRKARESSLKIEVNSSTEKAKIEKRRKLEEDAMIKSKQAAQECSILEDKFDKKCQEMERIKIKILADIRELIYQCDQTTKACTFAYFQAVAGLWAPLPMQYQSLSENTREYVPGVEYLQFVQQLPCDQDVSKFTSFSKGRANSDDQLPVIQVNGHPVKPPPVLLETQTSYPALSSTYDSGDDTSISSYADVSTTGYKSPPITRGKSEKLASRFSAISDAARSHNLQKVRLPTKCYHCETYTFFQTVQCTECNMNWHRECLTSMNVYCCDSSTGNYSNSSRKMSIFGIPLIKHLQETESLVPDILVRCINQLETRGLTIKGLYRVCGVKTKIEELCEDFEREDTDLDLSCIHPTNIASVVKLYLRQLPEPIFTHDLYSDFIKIAKDFPAERPVGPDVVPPDVRLKSVIQKLPSANYETAKALILHLNRLTWFESENQMSSSNLGIVFGPTLLWKEEGKAGPSLNSLIETPTQTRAVELIVEYAYEIFDADPSADMNRLGVIRRPQASAVKERRRHTRSFHVNNPFISSTYHSAIEASIPEETRRTTATPDLLKHDRSLSAPMSHGSLEFLDLSDHGSPQSASTPIDNVSATDNNVTTTSSSDVPLSSNGRSGFDKTTNAAVAVNDGHTTVIPIFDVNNSVAPPPASTSAVETAPFQRNNRPVVRRTPSKRSLLMIVNSEPNNAGGGESLDGRDDDVIDGRTQPEPTTPSAETGNAIDRRHRAATDPNDRPVNGVAKVAVENGTSKKKSTSSDTGLLFGLDQDELAYV